MLRWLGLLSDRALLFVSALAGSTIPGLSPMLEEKKEVLQWANQFQQPHERLFCRVAEI
jgi:hypothetical protein